MCFNQQENPRVVNICSIIWYADVNVCMTHDASMQHRAKDAKRKYAGNILTV